MFHACFQCDRTLRVNHGFRLWPSKEKHWRSKLSPPSWNLNFTLAPPLPWQGQAGGRNSSRPLIWRLHSPWPSPGPPSLPLSLSPAPSLSPSLLLLPSLPLSPFLPLSCSFPLSLSVQAALPAWLSLPRGNEPRPAYSVQIMSRIKTESPLSRASSISASGPEASDTSSQRGRLFSAYPGVLSLLTAYVFPRWWDEWRWCYLGFACLMITLCGFVGFVYS